LKLNSILVGSVVFVIACNVSAYTEDLLTLDNLEDKNSMTWPMLPGESLNELAAKFYPDNKIMQKQFVFKTLRLNTELLPQLDPNTDFAAPTALIIPTLKSLSFSTRAINSSNKKSNKPSLQISYSIKTAIEGLPKSLLMDYEDLVIRNTFLKEELAKLNEKLAYLQAKLNDLRLILDKTLTLPEKKIVKNTDQGSKSKPIVKPVVANTQNTKFALLDLHFDPFNKIFWLSVLAIAFILALGSYLLKKFREKIYIKSINSVTQQQALTSFDKSLKDTAKLDVDPAIGVPLKTDTQTDGFNESSILDEAKTMFGKGLTNEAIEHLKWAIRARPKASITLWLYLLELFRKQTLKDEFEKFAFEMHQNFNVMTPVWQDQEVAIVVTESLEKFPHIIEKIITEWPGAPAKSYLESLIADNRNGERTGFGQEVIDEILFLIAILETRNDLWEIKGLIKENGEQVV